MITIYFNILDKRWELRILTKKKYKKKRGSDSLASTLSWKRRIDMPIKAVTDSDEITLENIKHELVHAYLGEMCIHSTNDITKDDMEEIYCELFAKRGEEMIDLSKQLLEKVKASTTVSTE